MSNVIYNVNIAKLIDLLVKLEAQVTHVNIQFLPEENKFKLTRILKQLPPPPSIKLSDITDINDYIL